MPDATATPAPMPPNGTTTPPQTSSNNNVSLEVQLRAANDLVYKTSLELADKNKALALLTKELTASNERLSELESLKSELLALAVHRLRGPLVSIEGYASMISDGNYGAVPDTMKEPLVRVVESTDIMVSMIAEFIQASELASGLTLFNPVTFDIGDAIRETFAKAKALADSKKLVLKNEIASEPLNVSADLDQIKSVLRIVLDNAIRYTPDGGTITVHLAKSTGGASAHFEVIDTGIGMTTDTITKLFAKFFRGENANKIWVLGSGLGLYIAKKLVDMHKGLITGKSEGEGKGSTFVVEVPLLK